jgi:hypothetical protein
MKPIGTIAAGLVLVSGAAVAQAQTVVTRQITSEPVETVVIQGPNGTAVTRRILTPEPGVSTFAAPPLEYPPVAPQALEPQYVEPAAPALTRRVTTTAATTTSPSRTVGKAPPHTRAVKSRQASTRPARTVTRTVTARPAPDQALVLSPAQRQVIYRTVVQREIYPAPVPAGPPVVAQTEFYAPPVAGYPLRAAYPADDYAYGYRDYAYDNRNYNNYDPYTGRYWADSYRDQDYRDPYHTAYRWDGVPLVVGARIPPSVPLIAVPEPVATRIPVAAPYSYAVLDNRVYLVDPATSVIVAQITQ